MRFSKIMVLLLKSVFKSIAVSVFDSILRSAVGSSELAGDMSPIDLELM